MYGNITAGEYPYETFLSLLLALVDGNVGNAVESFVGIVHRIASSFPINISSNHLLQKAHLPAPVGDQRSRMDVVEATLLLKTLVEESE